MKMPCYGRRYVKDIRHGDRGRSVPSAQALCSSLSLTQKEKKCDSLNPPCYFLRQGTPIPLCPPIPEAAVLNHNDFARLPQPAPATFPPLSETKSPGRRCMSPVAPPHHACSYPLPLLGVGSGTSAQPPVRG